MATYLPGTGLPHRGWPLRGIPNRGIPRIGLGTPFYLDLQDPPDAHEALAAAGDVLYLKGYNGTAVIENWLYVQAVTDMITYFRYTVAKAHGVAGTFPKGAAAINVGALTAGGILRFSGDGGLQLLSHVNQPWNPQVEMIRWGNIDSDWPGCTGWGAAFGQYAENAKQLTIDHDHGLRAYVHDDEGGITVLFDEPLEITGWKADEETQSVGTYTFDTSEAPWDLPVPVKGVYVFLRGQWGLASDSTYMDARPHGYASPGPVRVEANTTFYSSKYGLVPCDEYGDFDVVVTNVAVNAPTLQIWGYMF